MARLNSRLTIFALAMCLCGTAATAQSGDDEKARTNRLSYDISMKCMIVDHILQSDAKSKGDSALAASYDASEHKAFDKVMVYGVLLGYVSNQINQDLDEARVQELPKLRNDIAYFKGEVNVCKTVHLM